MWKTFSDFPTGIQVPVGYYDKDKSAWIPSTDGRIVKIVGITDGIADLDTDGDNIADNDPALGITLAERTQLAATYPVGKSLQRVPVDHFSTYDFNFGTSLAPGSTPPKLEQPKSDKLDDPCLASGSIIECENQTLGETLGLTGTPFSLNYRSDRALGRKVANILHIPLSDSTVPSPLQRIELEISIAGRVITQSFPATPNQNYTFIWDGLDVYGRRVSGLQKVRVRIGYVYPNFYILPPALVASFGSVSGQIIPGYTPPSLQSTVLWQEYTSYIGQDDARESAQAAWELNVHHRYDPVSRTLYQGDGSQHSILSAIVSNVITTVAGNGTEGFSGDGGPATQAQLRWSSGIAVAADGSLYISDVGNYRIRRVGPDGIIATVAGNGTRGFSGDGGPATQAQLEWSIRDIAVAADGSLYISDYDNRRIRRVGPDGIITTVAGNGTYGSRGDGGPATQASLVPERIAVAADGSLYIGDNIRHVIRRVDPDGIITTVAGNGTYGSSGDGGPATQAQLVPGGVAVAADGSLYICDIYYHRIRRVGPDGIITTVAGNGTEGFSGDGGPATQAQIGWPSGIAATADGSLYISDSDNHRIRRVGPDGIITTVVGNGTAGFSGDGGPPTQAQLDNP